MYRARKHKPWQDGKLTLIEGKVVLFDDQNKKIDSSFLSKRVSLDDEEIIELDRNFVQVEGPFVKSLFVKNVSSVSTNINKIKVLPKFKPPKQIKHVIIPESIQVNNDNEYVPPVNNIQHTNTFINQDEYFPPAIEKIPSANTIKSIFNLTNLDSQSIQQLPQQSRTPAVDWGTFVDEDSDKSSDEEENNFGSLTKNNPATAPIVPILNERKRSTNLTNSKSNNHQSGGKLKSRMDVVDEEDDEIPLPLPKISMVVNGRKKLLDKPSQQKNRGMFINPVTSKTLNILKSQSPINLTSTSNSIRQISSLSSSTNLTTTKNSKFPNTFSKYTSAYNSSSKQSKYPSNSLKFPPKNNTQFQLSQDYLPFNHPVKFPKQMHISSISKIRTLTTPIAYETLESYIKTFSLSINEHIQVQVSSLASKFYQLKTNVNIDERGFRSKGVPLYFEAQLKRPYRGGYNAEPNIFSENNVLLSLSNREQSSKYSKDDLWIISTDSTFLTFTFMARAIYYGPTTTGSFELCPCSPQDVQTSIQTLSTAKFGDWIPVTAIRSLNVSTEGMSLDMLRDLETTGDAKRMEQSQEILAFLLNPVKARAESFVQRMVVLDRDGVLIADVVKEFSDKYLLNGDQIKVLESVVRSLEVRDDPITLVHGVFGSGKRYFIRYSVEFNSFVIAVLILLLNDLNEKGLLKRNGEDEQFRSLLKLGFTNFVRVGSLKKIAKDILPYTKNSLNGGAPDIKELESDPDLSQGELEELRNAIKSTTTKASSKTPLDISSFFVLGITCMATNFESVEHLKGGLLILDEASQMTEPVSLLPLVKFECQRMLLVGDPLQLPPTITTNGNTKTKGWRGLEYTMFERLQLAGIPPVKLRTQYRCHPYISGISNSMFYSGSLFDGVNMTDRLPVIENLPNLCFVNANGEENSSKGGSLFNVKEGEYVCELVNGFLSRGVPPSEIGVIAMYKTQVEMISEKLRGGNRKCPVQVSTVDAFQGGEKSIMLLSTVRTGSTGFLDNKRRANVAITRAKRHLFIIGKESLLKSNYLWRDVITNHCARQLDGQLNFNQILNVVKNNPIDTQVMNIISEKNNDDNNSDNDGEDFVQTINQSSPTIERQPKKRISQQFAIEVADQPNKKRPKISKTPIFIDDDHDDDKDFITTTNDDMSVEDNLISENSNRSAATAQSFVNDDLFKHQAISSRQEVVLVDDLDSLLVKVGSGSGVGAVVEEVVNCESDLDELECIEF